MKTIVIVGGTGAQGAEVIRYLSSTNQYRCLVLTRSTTSPRAQALSRLSNVELVLNPSEHGYDLDVYLAAAAQADFVFINTDGFSVGEQAETYWGIRLFEFSIRAGVKHFIYSGLDYIGKQTGYDSDLYVGHYEGKARVQEFMRAQPTSPMAWTIIRSGPYIESLYESQAPTVDTAGTHLFSLPLKSGAVPYIHLHDLARYVHWILSHVDEANGLDLGIATAHVAGEDIAHAFTATTGKPAKYVDLPLEQWVEDTWAKLPNGKDTKVGYKSIKDDNALVQTYGQNFENWWKLYRASADNQGLIQRDYQLLDKILPERVRTVEEWMRKVAYTGERRALLKSLDEFRE